jgi:stage II sporulation protein D
MNSVKRIFIGICIILQFPLNAGEMEIRVRLYNAPDKATLSIKSGHYAIVAASAGGEILDTIWNIHEKDATRIFYIRRQGSNVEISMQGLGKLVFEEIWLLPYPDHPDPSFLIQGPGRERWYQDKLHFFVLNKNELTIVNQVKMEKYVAGVVESEGGRFNELEYFKAQAVLARTFAIKNLKKHINDRYNLRDDVSSQVYHSRAYLQNSEAIREAVQATRDSVLIDSDGDIVLGLFHANSGGQTANAGDVWSKDISYLRSKPDPFSVGQTSYSWTKKVSRQDVLRFAADNLGTNSGNPDLKTALLNFTQEERKSHFEFNGKRIKLTQFRARFGLRSTFFTIHEEGDFFVFTGKGFGHGVGLSQDGAIKMSSSGFSYENILYFYFENTKLENIVEIINNNEALRKMVSENALWLDTGYPNGQAP